MSTPNHRLIPVLSDENKYVADIIEMRRSIQGIDTPEGLQIGPISHALETIENFGSSASEWTRDHIIRFQVVCLMEQPASKMYPSQFLPGNDDPLMKAFDEEKFFDPTIDAVKVGDWKYDNLNNNFFLDLIQLLIGVDVRTISLPATRQPKPRESKSSVRQEIQKTIADPENHQHITRATHGWQSPDSLFTADTASTDTLIYWGPRETSTNSLFHNLLKSIASLEWDVDPLQEKMWLPWKLPVVAAGQIFACENDGGIHMWTRTAFTAEMINTTPVCQIECKRGHHNKDEASILAQEVAELLGMALLNYATDTPSIELKDESFLLCCHHTSFHISSAIVPSKYIEGVHLDELKEDDYLVVKRSQKYDLAIPSQRRRAVREIIGLLRYLKDISH